MIKRINFWVIFAFLVPLVVAIPIFTVFLSFFDTTGNYLDLLKDTFLLRYLSNSFLILLGVLLLTTWKVFKSRIELIVLILDKTFGDSKIACLSIFTSAILKDNTSALSIILSIWILWTIFIPKIFGNAAEKIYPLPSRQVFKTTMNFKKLLLNKFLVLKKLKAIYLLVLMIHLKSYLMKRFGQILMSKNSNMLSVQLVRIN